MRLAGLRFWLLMTAGGGNGGAFTVIAVGLLIGLTGCQRVTPVEEVSIKTSGVEVVELVDAAALTNEWNGWRGPKNNGVAPDNAATATKWDLAAASWQAEVPGRGHSSPVVVKDLVLIATAVKSKQQQRLLAYDRGNGDLRWSATVHEGNFPSRGEIHHKATNANSTVACDGKRIYCSFFNAGKIIVTAYDMEGQKEWTKPLGAFNSKFGYAPSPILYRSLVVVAADNRGGGYLVALDGATGKIAWRTKRPAVATYSSPFIANVDGKDQLLISGGNALTSFDPTTGEQNWQTACISEATCGTVVTDGERVFASGGYPERQTVALSGSGKILWSNRTQLYEPSLICIDDLLVAVTDKGIAYCWDAKTGKKHWDKRLGGSFSASPIAVNGLIYVPDLSGKTYVFRASADGYDEVAVNRMGDDCYASIAVSAGEIFMRPGFGRGDERVEKLICIPADSTTSAQD